MEFLKPTRGLSWSPVESGLTALGCVQASRSLHEKLHKSGGAGRAQKCTGPARPASAELTAPPARLCPELGIAWPVPWGWLRRLYSVEAVLTGGCTQWRLYSVEAGRHGVPASLFAVLSALGNAGLMFSVFFSFPTWCLHF